MNATSLYARVLVAVYDLCAAAPWVGEKPTVGLGGFLPADEGADEWVMVLTAAPMDEQQDWAALGCRSRDENLTVTIDVGTTVPGRTPHDALARLEEITSVIEDRIRATATGTEQPMSLAENMVWWGVVAVDPFIGPHTSGEGYAAACTISVGVRARI